MADFAPLNGTATVAANAQVVTIAGCDITNLAPPGGLLYLGSRNRRTGDGYVIASSTPNGTSGGTVTLLDPVPTAFNAAPFRVDPSNLPTAGSLATALFTQTINYLQGLLGVGTNLYAASKVVALDKTTDAATGEVRYSTAGRKWFGIRHAVVNGVNRLLGIAYPDGTQEVQAFAIDSATGGFDHLTHSTDVVAAATTDLGAAPSRKVRITGTTTITSFGLGMHKERLVRFSDGATMVNSASLVLPGGVDIAANAGDMAVITSDGSTPQPVWTVRQYTRMADVPMSPIAAAIIFG